MGEPDRVSIAVADRDEHDEDHHAEPDQDVADREDVRERQGGWQGEDVAEEPEPVSRLGHVRAAGKAGEACSSRSRPRDGHLPTVRNDRSRVQRKADKKRCERAQTQVRRGEREQKHVGDDVSSGASRVAELAAEIREEHDLQRERHDDEPTLAELKLEQPRWTSTEQRGEPNAHQEAREQEHLRHDRQQRRHSRVGAAM